MSRILKISYRFIRLAGLFILVFMLSGCPYNLPQSMWKTYDSHGPGSADVPPRLNLFIADFEEGDNAIKVKGGLGRTEALVVGVQQAGLDPLPKRFAKWLSEELSSTRYFQSVKYVESKEKLESSSDADLLVQGRLKKCYFIYPPVIEMIFFVFPPQSLLVLMGMPVCCLGHEIEIEINVSPLSDPENILYRKNINIKDQSKWITIYRHDAPDQYQYFASRQKILLSPAYLEFREELAKESLPGGKIHEALKGNRSR